MFKTIFYNVGNAYGLFLRLKYLSIVVNLINFLKRLWTGYQDRQRYRKEVQRRLLRQRDLKHERSPESGHWTDRFLSSTVAVVPVLSFGSSWKLVFPLVFLLGLLAYMPVMAKSDLDAELSVFADSIQPLKVGDRMPDLVISVYQDGQFKKVSLSDYQGKLVIVDFWATWCGSCISKLAEDESLQNEFADRLLFLMVNSTDTGDSLENAQRFLTGWQKSHGLELTSPMLFEDQLFNQYFPRTALPHYVWIDGNGTVRAITRKESVTRANVLKALQDDEYNLPLKTF